jgi:hypothetical protein
MVPFQILRRRKFPRHLGFRVQILLVDKDSHWGPGSSNSTFNLSCRWGRRRGRAPAFCTDRTKMCALRRHLRSRSLSRSRRSLGSSWYVLLCFCQDSWLTETKRRDSWGCIMVPILSANLRSVGFCLGAVRTGNRACVGSLFISCQQRSFPACLWQCLLPSGHADVTATRKNLGLNEKVDRDRKDLGIKQEEVKNYYNDLVKK